MLRLAGEIADGVVLWLCNPAYVREMVVPTITEGRAKAGKPAEGFDIVAAVPSAVTGEPDQARAQLRSELIPYFSLPFYRKMIELSGYGDDLAGFDESGPEAISDDFISTLAAIGTAEEAAESVRRYADSGTTSPCIGGISKTDFDTTLEALAGCV
jgi:alkanesulfonate monooxygenase SsuD/methylene tetrahydromethanopterin reductase-like flavin-dependent oxidoreductase (luciferase family)